MQSNSLEFTLECMQVMFDGAQMTEDMFAGCGHFDPQPLFHCTPLHIRSRCAQYFGAPLCDTRRDGIIDIQKLKLKWTV